MVGRAGYAASPPSALSYATCVAPAPHTAERAGCVPAAGPEVLRSGTPAGTKAEKNSDTEWDPACSHDLACCGPGPARSVAEPGPRFPECPGQNVKTRRAGTRPASTSSMQATRVADGAAG